MSNLICTECGTVIPEGSQACPECGNPVVQQTDSVPVASVSACPKCGMAILANQPFCPNCGTSINAVKKKKNKVIVPVTVAVLGCVIVAAVVMLLPPKVEKVQISQNSVELAAGDTFKVNCTILPEKAEKKSKTEWESSNEAVATVDEQGMITAVGDGKTTVTVKAKDKSASIDVTVKSVPDLKEVYDQIGGDGYYAKVAGDGSYLYIDTNPLDKKSSTDLSGWAMVKAANKALNFPESTYNKMASTRALDGRVSDEHDGVSVSWTYHPDQGLEVLYEVDK